MISESYIICYYTCCTWSPPQNFYVEVNSDVKLIFPTYFDFSVGCGATKGALSEQVS